MIPKTKNIIIFLALAAIFVLVYIFFIKSPPEETGLISSPPDGVLPSTTAEAGAPNSSITADFLSLLLSVKNIKLDDAIFSDNAFNSLIDSSITLIPDGNEGRPNPFAPLGVDNIPPSPNTLNIPNTPPNTGSLNPARGALPP